MSHIPVLLEDVVRMAAEIQVKEGLFVDATFGRGGHTQAIMNARPDFKMLGIDCDEAAIQYGRIHFAKQIEEGRLALFRGNFSQFNQILSNYKSALSTEVKVLGALMDLGVSSPQLDEGHRGFSFYHDGPLDMRMDQSLEVTAADIVNTWDEKGLNELFQTLGEVRSPYRVTNKIIEQRKKNAFSTTGELSRLIEATDGWRKKGHHPATNYFMALRLEINQEMLQLERALPIFVQALAPQGRLFVITFHSLEDRLVKVAMKDFEAQGLGRIVNKKVIQASWQDQKKNPRSRSAKLRVFEKGEPS